MPVPNSPVPNSRHLEAKRPPPEPSTALAGVSVVVTRAADQQGELAHKLRAHGATVEAIPLLTIVAPADGGRALRTELGRIDEYDWLVVTSPNGARVVVGERGEMRPARGIAAIGPGTAAVFAAARIEVDLVPDRSVGEGLVESFPPGASQRVLLAQAEGARRVVAEGLIAKGYDVTSVVAYRSVDATVDPSQRDRAAHADAVLFTSSSTVERFVRLVGPEALPPTVGVIGPITADTARAAGIDVAFTAEQHTLDGLVEAFVRWVKAPRVKE